MNFICRTTALLLLFSLSVSALQQQQQVAKDQPASPYHGQIEGRLYTNDRLGLSYELPDGFFVRSDLPDQFSGANMLLLIADQHTGTPWRNRLVMTATNAAQSGGIAERFARKVVAASPTSSSVAVLRDVYRLQVDGHEFFRIDYKKTDQGKTLYETFVCAPWKGSFLSWTFVSLSPEQLDQAAASIKSVSLR